MNIITPARILPPATAIGETWKVRESGSGVCATSETEWSIAFATPAQARALKQMAAAAEVLLEAQEARKARAA